MQANILQAMAKEAQRLGCIKGESATQWRKRDPMSAEAFATWIKANMPAVTKELAAHVG